MSKSTYFTGQPVLNQLLSFVDKAAIKRIADRGGYDKYYKSFTTYAHLITMLYCCFTNCTSSREVVSGMKACYHKLKHLGITKVPGKSTLCETNQKRSSEVFEHIYKYLYQRHKHLLPDSRSDFKSKLYIADATVISLFQQILKAPYMGKASGKRKGGIKVHTLLNAQDDLASQISFTSARANDMTFLKEITLSKSSFIVFDKGYSDYFQYQRISNEGVYFVTRQRRGASYSINQDKTVTVDSHLKGVCKDQIITLGTRTHPKKIKLKSRLVTFYDQSNDRVFEFLTNNFDLLPEEIANIYKKRWQIELVFKRIKQNYPLKYFLGDNENAIKIQIWCVFIADLIVKLVHSLTKRKWAYSNLRTIIRLHLMSYINLWKFLNNPDKLPHNVKIIPKMKNSTFEIPFPS